MNSHLSKHIKPNNKINYQIKEFINTNNIQIYIPQEDLSDYIICMNADFSSFKEVVDEFEAQGYYMNRSEVEEIIKNLCETALRCNIN